MDSYKLYRFVEFYVNGKLFSRHMMDYDYDLQIRFLVRYGLSPDLITKRFSYRLMLADDLPF